MVELKSYLLISLLIFGQVSISLCADQEIILAEIKPVDAQSKLLALFRSINAKKHPKNIKRSQEDPENSDESTSNNSSSVEEPKRKIKKINRRSRNLTKVCESVCERVLTCQQKGRKRCPRFGPCGCGNLKNEPILYVQDFE